MYKENLLMQRNKLFIAMGLALVGSTMTGCSSSDGNSSNAGVTISANGGLSGNALYTQGGEGGELYIYNNGTTGGIEIRKTGSVATSFTTPSTPQVSNLGDNPLLINVDTLIDTPVLYTVVTDAAGALSIDQLYVDSNNILRTSAAGGVANYASDPIVADGSFYRSSAAPNELFQALGDDATADLAVAGLAYFRNGYSNIYITDGTNATGDAIASGLSVAAGATLTLSDNSSCNSVLYVNQDIDNKGTIKPVNNNCTLSVRTGNIYFGTGELTSGGTSDQIDGGSLSLYANQGINNSGSINANGYSSADADGGDGGEVMLDANGYIINSGQISSAGGDGLNAGGNAGSVYVWGSPAYTENRGTMDISGGNSTGVGADQDNGGDGGELYLNADVVLNNASIGIISANGGNGTSGGRGGNVNFYTSDDIGALVNAGNITVNGGDGTTASGGNAGSIYFETDGGADIKNSANLTAKGGTTADESSNGGQGGNLEIYADYGSYGPGNIEVSGGLNVNGGNAMGTGSGQGGNGGQVEIYNDVSNNFSDQRIALLGYDLIEANGGDGAEGGNANWRNAVEIYTSNAYNSNNGEDYSGPIFNEVPINALGGNTTVSGSSFGQGGNGGEVEIYTTSYNIVNLGVTLTNSATINVSGGTGYDGANDGVGGGHGGDIYLGGKHGVDNSANLLANAGEGGTEASGGGYVEIWTESGTVTNSGAISANGAVATYSGGYGGEIYMNGDALTNSASLSVTGGNATDATESYGGDGGYINLSTNTFLNLNNSGSLAYSFGTGVTQNGDEGCAVTNFITAGNCNIGD
ncbi:MAG TPA: hypothetical protein VIQ03_01205 [Gammaproteobacteria bacterium]